MQQEKAIKKTSMKLWGSDSRTDSTDLNLWEMP